MKKKVKPYPAWICSDCGIEYCKGLPGTCYATYHIGTCQCCEKPGVPVTEPRDYGHFVEWPVVIDHKNVKSNADQDLGEDQKQGCI